MNDRSEKALSGVHADLDRVIRRATGDGAEFIVTEGLRSLERQKELCAQGRSQTLRSRHLTGHAVDVVAVVEGNASYDDAAMRALADQIKAAAQAEGVPIEWGGDWKSFCDTPHFQLPVKQYPVDKPKALAETKTAANATVQIATGSTLAPVGAVMTVETLSMIERVDKLSLTNILLKNPLGLVLVAIGILLAIGGIWQLRDRAKKLLQGV